MLTTGIIDNLLTNGTATQCAIKAGYSKKSAKVEASRLLKQDKVLKALQTISMKSLGYRSISALDTVSNLSQNANSEYKYWKLVRIYLTELVYGLKIVNRLK